MSGALPPPAVDEDDLLPGTPAGEYVVEAVLGRGGMGTVYRAAHPVIGKKVAIKVLKGVLSDDPGVVQRFTIEARAVNAIRHRNLVDIFSFSQLPDGRWYYVMEYLDGESLGDRLRARVRLPPNEAIPILVDVAAALEAAHAKGVVHRDLKPDNIFLCADPVAPGVKLLDFGVAKLLEGHGWTTAARTAHGSTLGTPHYMAPEQARGQTIDGRTDIYALGVVAYETVTGVRPIDGDNPLEVCRAHVVTQPERAINRAPNVVTPELDRIIMKLLAKEPGQRWQTAGEVRRALAALAGRR